MHEKIITTTVQNKNPRSNARTVVYQTNHITEMRIIEREPQELINCRKLNSTEYVDTSTGEIKKYKHHNTSNKSINRSLTTLKRLINNNFVGNKNELHLTLTYSKSLLDKNQLSADFKKFWKKLKYRYATLEYISIYERHKSGIWHIHCLIKDITGKRLFLPHNELEQLWQQGYIHITRIRNNNNIGAYFCKYVKTDNNVNPIEDYPKGSKLYSSSRGIQKPIPEIMSYDDASKLVKDENLTFQHTVNIVLTNGVTDEIVNTIHYRQYNSKK